VPELPCACAPCRLAHRASLPLPTLVNDPGQGPEFVTISLSRTAAVKAGKVYAIILHSDVEIEFSLAWEGSAGSNLYPGGGEAQRFDASAPWKVFPQDDYFFKTFVTPARGHRHK
jgi:hypothetical protein